MDCAAFANAELVFCVLVALASFGMAALFRKKAEQYAIHITKSATMTKVESQGTSGEVV